ncbi:serine hydrolase [Microlunatus antarcticus]|uniref:Beta-lactamase class A n=1 Tax=Microlunatus antarcticus TaxID=53388 RepID=A0A7W5JRX6_9ACTN|nr:serine hydrolase [Microlunatus antarcticus]MBB3325138.1 beta-lactamase class A [Microlunatus antarcticus]
MSVLRTVPRPYPSLAFRRLRALTILLVLVALVNLVVHALDRPTTAPVSSPPAAAAPAAEVPPPPPAIVVANAVDDWHAQESGHLAVVVADLQTGRTTSYGDVDHAFATASVVKVDILATLLLQEQGKLSSAQKEVAGRMIRQSSNGAASTLWKQIDREKGLAAANATFGLTGTKGGTKGRWGATTTTAADQLRLLQVVFTEDSPLTPDARAYLQSLMGGVASDQDWGVTAADSRGDTHAYVKNGWLPRTGGWVVTSVGRVEHEGHPLLVAALSDGGATQKKGVSVVELVSKNAAKDVTGA